MLATRVPTGWALCWAWHHPGWRGTRLAVLAGAGRLNGASEVVSFTKVIRETPALNWLDMLGRRPRTGSGPRAAQARARPGAGGRPHE